MPAAMPTCSDRSRRRGPWRPPVALALLVVAAVCAGCGSGAHAARPPTSKQLVEQLTPTERMVDVGGYKLFLRCDGSGQPTVVFLNGFGGVEGDWDAVRQETARLPRMCSYDPAGTGNSDDAPNDRSSPDQASHDLAVMLKRSGEQPPFLLVGWSWGGLTARVFLDHYPNLVAGMVLVDASSEHDPTVVGHAKTGDTTFDMTAGRAQATGLTPLGRLPLVVLTARYHAGATRAEKRAWSRWQAGMARLSTDAIHVLALRSDHPILINQPLLVSRAILDIATAVDNHAPLKPCDERYVRLGGRCLT